MESQNRAVVYLDLLGFAALVEANPLHFASGLVDKPHRQTWPNIMKERQALCSWVRRFWGLLHADCLR
jgi:hypothetical protein